MPVRRATLADRAAVRTLMTRVVNGTSAIQELRTEWGPEAADWTLADLAQLIAQPRYEMPLAFDAGGVLRGFEILFHNPLPLNGAEHDGWEMIYVITDKRLSLTNRLQVHREIAVASAGLVEGGVYLWGDVKTPGNLDTFLNGDNANFPSFVGFDRYAVESRGQNCHRYYATAADIITRFA